MTYGTFLSTVAVVLSSASLNKEPARYVGRQVHQESAVGNPGGGICRRNGGVLFRVCAKRRSHTAGSRRADSLRLRKPQKPHDSRRYCGAQWQVPLHGGTLRQEETRRRVRSTVLRRHLDRQGQCLDGCPLLGQCEAG